MYSHGGGACEACGNTTASSDVGANEVDLNKFKFVHINIYLNTPIREPVRSELRDLE
jgi:hypothetical protein